MNNKLTKLESLFFNSPGISIIEVNSLNSQSKYYNIFYNFICRKEDSILVCDCDNYYELKTKKIIIPNLTCEHILLLLSKNKNITFFISTPINVWLYGHTELNYNISSIFFDINQICLNNNINIVLSERIRKTQSSHYKNNKINLVNLYVQYINDEIHILKNRYGENNNIKVENLFINIIREKKIKRILSYL